MRTYGSKAFPQKMRDYEYDICCKTTSIEELPRRFMLPIDEWATVLNQFNTMACVSFALSTAQEVNYFKKTGERKKWSPGYIYGNPLCRSYYAGKGMYLDTAIRGTMKSGFVPLQQFDILVEMPEMMSYVENRDDLLKLGEKWKLKGFVNLYNSNLKTKIEKMKQALYNYQVPLIVSSRNYFGGGHAFIIYGWDDDMVFKKYAKNNTIFALRNSWGKNYENGGNYFIPASEVDGAFLPLFEEIPFPFVDVKEADWFYKDVRSATLSGLVQGFSKTQFDPYADMIRGDVAVTSARLMAKLEDSINIFIETLSQKGENVKHIKIQKLSAKYPFIDVAPNDYYRDEIGISFANGILNGVTENLFEPTRGITRGEFAATVVRMYTYIVDLINTAIPSAKIQTPSSATLNYPDVPTDAWYCEYISLAKQLGFMHGDDSSSFRPDDNIIRAEATAVLNRLFKAVDELLDKIC